MLELIERGEAETAAREFVENVAVGPGAWEMMTPEERASLVANADTFAGEQRDPEWADADLDAFSRITVPVLLTQGDQSPRFFKDHRAVGRGHRGSRGEDAAGRWASRT